MNRVDCDPDISFDVENFYEGTFDMPLMDTFCPLRDVDFWRFTMETGKLARVEIEYNFLSNIQIGTQWWRQAGKCTEANPAACTTTDDCTGDLSCDTLRGCIPGNAPDCFLSGTVECASAGLTCNLSTTALPREPALENRDLSSPDQHRVVAYYPAFNGGDHWLAVADNQEVTESDEDQYTLTVTQVDDPDLNEPNNARTSATALTSGTPVNAALSYQLDTDWYVIQPITGQPTILDVELRADANSVAEAVWVVFQGATRLETTQELAEGTGDARTRVLRQRTITESEEPIFVQVTNRNTTMGTAEVPPFNPDDRYTLTVTVLADTNEGPNRDDDPVTAQLANVTAIGTGWTSAPATIISPDDSDWYKLDAGDFPTPTVGSGNANSLLEVSVITAAEDPVTENIVLEAQFFRPNGVACSPTMPCVDPMTNRSLGVCAEDIGECIEVWLQRPDPLRNSDEVGDDAVFFTPESGGLSPNRIQVMLPLHRSKGPADVMDDDRPDDPRIYLRVGHRPASVIGTTQVRGFSETTTYTVTATQFAEPDEGDDGMMGRQRDNDFRAVILSTERGEQGRGFFNGIARDGGNITTSPAVGGSPFVQVVPGTVLDATALCVPVALEAYDGTGMPRDGMINVDFGANFFGDAACTVGMELAAAAEITFAAGTATVYYDIANSTDADGDLDYALTVDGRVYDTPSVAGRATTYAGPRLLNGGPGVYTEIPLSLATALPMDATVTYNTAGATARIGCQLGAQDTCARMTDTCTPNGAAGACTATPLTGLNAIAVRLSGDAAGVVELIATSPTFADTRILLASAIPSGGMSATLRGYISYIGDQDYFDISVPGAGNGGMTGMLMYPASPVDLRVELERGGNEGPLGEGDVRDDVSACPNGMDTPRRTCDKGPKNETRGIGAGECFYAFDGETISVSVNDVYSNDWDLTGQYEITVELVPGCSPTACNAFICSAN